MAVDFPASPTLNQTYTDSGRTWRWNGTGWQLVAPTLAVGNVTGAAPLASPTFTGTPAGPTPAADTNTTQLATTAFFVGQAGTVQPLMAGIAAAGTSLRFSRADHVHPSDTTRAPLASPTFTGTPAAPTPAADTNTTQLATTAFVLGQASSTVPAMNGTAAVGTSTRHARADHVHPTDTSRAPLASPTFTGTPAAPTAATGTNTTQLATTAFVQEAVSANSGISYETGTRVITFSPTATGSITLLSSANTVHYTKIGNFVFCTGRVQVSAVSSPSGTGVIINNLFPVAPLSANSFGVKLIDGRDATVRLERNSNTAGGLDMAANLVAVNQTYTFSFHYVTA